MYRYVCYLTNISIKKADLCSYLNYAHFYWEFYIIFLKNNITRQKVSTCTILKKLKVNYNTILKVESEYLIKR